ncbi:hypothetical protein F4803DRAFT_295861 [Xylaria telfairii]|nr:hypothetical protein F4803DRAFT_295861 [Xylaria telfairii]
MTLTDVLDDVPSWSWARTGGAKRWLTDLSDPIPEVRANFHNNEPKILSVSGLLRVIDRSTPASYCCVRNHDFYIFYSIEESLFYDFDLRLQCPHILKGRSGRVLGFGVFDAQVASHCVFAPWASTERPSESIEFLEQQYLGGHEMSDQEPICDKDDCIDIPHTMTPTLYFGLLLEPVDNATTRFKRVGAGIMYSPAFDNERLVPQDYEIV